jgi:tetratricopeptide (TPR) repeat protein
MDKQIHIDSIRRNLGITLEAVSRYNSANRNEIENIESIFNLQDTNKEKVLALLYLLASGTNNEVIQKYRNQTDLQETLYDSDSESVTKYNLMLVTTLIYVPTFYTMAVNYYGAVSIGLPVKARDDKFVSIRKRRNRNLITFFPKTVKKVTTAITAVPKAIKIAITIPAVIAVSFASLYQIPSFQLIISRGLTLPSDPGASIAMVPITTEDFLYIENFVLRYDQIRGEKSTITDELNETITKYTETLKTNPNNYDTCKNLFFLYMEIGSWAKVVEFSTKALEIRKGDPLALYTRGIAYYKMGGHNQNALEDLQAVLKMDIQNKKALYYAMMWIYRQEASEAEEKLKAIDPDFFNTDEDY